MVKSWTREPTVCRNGDHGRPEQELEPGHQVAIKGIQVMKTTKLRNMLIGGIGSAVACILQIIGLVRYVGRLPDDWVGIGLYIATIVAFAVAAFGFYAQAQKA
jgi:hypothetical protein